MIKYKLVCKSCKFTFDSWFASSNEYEKLKKKHFLSCHICNSKKVGKTLMAPKLLKKTNKYEKEKNNYGFNKIKKKIKEYQKFIKKNFKYVGDDFAYEARSIHYNDKKNDKGIYGTASNKELKELREEGIEAEVIPWIRDKNN